MLGTLISSHIGLFVNCAFSASSAILLFRTARHPGPAQVPQAIVAVCATLFFVTYMVDLMHGQLFARTIDIRRGISWVFWPSLTWATYCGLEHRKQVKRDAERFVKLVQGVNIDE